MNKPKKIAITMGDPAGIGPEIIVKSLNDIDCNLNNFVLIGNKSLFQQYCENNDITMPEIEFINIDCNLSEIQTGIESKASGDISFKCLEHACKMAKQELVSAIVTAPLSKNAINMAGYNYSGQTEILESYLSSSGQHAEMLFVAGGFKVLLLTRHIKLEDVPKFLTRDKIVESVGILNDSLKQDFHVSNPKIAICGLNPHAGEGGLLGKEEQEIIIPAMKDLKDAGVDVNGPFPADTLFVKAANAHRKNEAQPYDCYVACYHDQGLTPIKVCAMDKTVNTTIGLPILRTSPAHGTAFDIAGKNIADYNSMKEAIILAYNATLRY